MSPTRPCTTVRAPRHASLPVRSPEDALEVVACVFSQPAATETVCLLLDHAHCGGLVLSVAGAGEAEQVDHVGALVAELATSDPHLGAVVLATARPGRTTRPTHDDELTFLGLRGRFEEAGVDLLDWFLVANGLATSLAELTDARPLWRSP